MSDLIASLMTSICPCRCASLSSFSMVGPFVSNGCVRTPLHHVCGRPPIRAHFTNLLRFLASRSSVAMSDLMQRSITSFTAWSAHLWMSSFGTWISPCLSMPSFGIFFGFNR